MNFIQNQDLGFKKEQQVILPLRNANVEKNYNALKTELLKIPTISSVTAGTTYPGFELVQDNSFYAEEKTIEDQVWIRFAQGKEDYIKTLGYQLLHGRFLPKDQTSTIEAIILNESAVKDLGYKVNEAVGRKIYYETEGERNMLEIIGVVKDFHYQNLHEKITPYGIRPLNVGQANYVIINARGNIEDTMASIQSTWRNMNSDTPFEYSFLDDDFQKNYEAEQRISKSMSFFAIIAISIACIGLFGLASFATEQRRKEVGIRRVLGASVAQITSIHFK